MENNFDPYRSSCNEDTFRVTNIRLDDLETRRRTVGVFTSIAVVVSVAALGVTLASFSNTKVATRSCRSEVAVTTLIPGSSVSCWHQNHRMTVEADVPRSTMVVSCVCSSR